MREFIVTHLKLEHLLCGFILISRLGDIGSTFLVTPTLKLEANPIVRRLGWPFALLTLLVCFVPYFSTSMGIIILVPSLMVSASNTARIWFYRTYGESEARDLFYQLARKSKLSQALLTSIVSALFVSLVGVLLVLLCPDPGKDWGYWFGIGFLAYALAIGFYGCLSFIPIFRQARRERPIQPSVARPD